MNSSSVNTVLYAASAARLADSRLYAAAYAAASPERRNKTDRFRFAKDRQLSLCAQLLLDYGLRAAGLNSSSAELIYGENGKPCLNDSSIYFNLSHSNEYALCAISSCEVGCDVEQITPIDLKIARRFFFRSEYDEIAAQPTFEERNDLFFRYWTLKESFMKVTGLGMQLPLDSFQIVRKEKISVIQSVDRRSYSFSEFQSIPGYKCAVCTADGSANAELQIIDPENAVFLR